MRNHEQQVGTACQKCILLTEGCLFTILLQSIQQENSVTKGLVKKTQNKWRMGLTINWRKVTCSSPDLKNTQTAMALPDLTRKAWHIALVTRC